MLKGKRGEMPDWLYPVIILGAIALVIGAVTLFNNSGGLKKFFTSYAPEKVEYNSYKVLIGGSWVWMDYIFGKVPIYLINLVGETSAIVITISAWLMLLLTFGHIFSIFSSFDKGIGWAIGSLLAIIAANIGFATSVLIFLLGLMSFLGSLAVIAGLFSAFAVFLGVNWGISSWAPWIMRRKAMIYVHQSKIEAKKGAQDVLNAVTHFKEIGKALSSKK